MHPLTCSSGLAAGPDRQFQEGSDRPALGGFGGSVPGNPCTWHNGGTGNFPHRKTGLFRVWFPLRKDMYRRVLDVRDAGKKNHQSRDPGMSADLNGGRTLHFRVLPESPRCGPRFPRFSGEVCLFREKPCPGPTLMSDISTFFTSVKWGARDRA